MSSFKRWIAENKYICLSLLISTIIFIKIDKTLLVHAEMWAEFGSNYFYNAHYLSFGKAILTDDYGYLPLFPRVWSIVVELVRVPALFIPYFYQLFTLVFFVVCTCLFSLNFYRPVVKSDLIRFLMCLFLCFNLDFELHTFINIPYYGAIPLALYLFFPELYEKISPAKKWLIGFAFFLVMASKALFLAVAPAFGLWFIYLLCKKRFSQILIPFLALAGAVAQVVFILWKNNLPKIDFNVTPFQILQFVIVQTTQLFYTQLLGKSVISDNPFVAYAMLLLFFVLSAYCLYSWKKKREWRKLRMAFFSLVVVFFCSTVNAKVAYQFLPKQFVLGGGFLGYRTWLIPCAFVFVFYFYCLSDWVSRKIASMTNPKRAIVATLATFAFFKSTGTFSANGFSNYAWPTIEHSQWSYFSEIVAKETPSYCIPLNPAPWMLKHQCTPYFVPTYPELRFEKESQSQQPVVLDVGQAKKVFTSLLYYKEIQYSGELSAKLCASVAGENCKEASLKVIKKFPNFIYIVAEKSPGGNYLYLKGIQSISLEDGKLLYSLFENEGL